MRHLILLFASASLLAACDGLFKEQTRASDPRDSDDRLEAAIMVGRVEVMQDQTQAGLRLLGAPFREAEAVLDRDPYRRLQGTVARFNTLREACVARAGNLCPPAPYLPAWYARPGAASGAEVRRMAEEMQDRMMPFWDAVCDRAKAKTGNQHFCAIE
jgi:hypothetical protein